MVLCGTMAFGACSDDDPAAGTHPESADADADRLTGIDDSDEGASDLELDGWVQVDTTQLAFTMDVPDGVAIRRVESPVPEAECAVIRYDLAAPDDRGLTIEAVPASCAVDNDAPGNGNHGTYRTLDDVAEQPSDVDEVENGFATAALFEQDYFECTNECNDYVDSVAIITLDDPRSAKYPTFVIRSDKSGYDVSELTAMVETLATP